MAVRLVAVGYVDDTQRPFQYFCSSAPNGVNPIADAHRTGTGQFNQIRSSGVCRLTASVGFKCWLETRKQVGPRISLSLWTDHEYISSVPKVLYADDNRPTRIDDEGIFASRTMLRLNIGLGSQQLYTMSR
jgi:hypothetical protein